MTNEATNSDVEKLIKYARINAECGEHASPEETLKLVAALQREVDIRAQNLSIKLHMAERIAGLEKTLRGTEESLIAAVDQIAELEAAPNGMMQLSNELAEMKRSKLVVKLPALTRHNPEFNKGVSDSAKAIIAAGGTVEGSE